MPSIFFVSTLRHSRRRRGFTLTELAIVMGIIGVVLGGVWVAASSLMTANKSKQAAVQITTIANNIRYLYGSRGSFTTLNEITGSLIKANVFPSELLSNIQAVGQSGQNRPTNAWYAGAGSGTVAIYVADGRTFRVSYYGVDAASCTRIASALIGTQDNGASGPINFITNGGSSGQTNLMTTTMTSQTISNACANNTTTANSSAEFDYRLQ